MRENRWFWGVEWGKPGFYREGGEIIQVCNEGRDRYMIIR